MKRKWLIVLGITLGGLLLLILLVAAAGPLLVGLGIEPICITGDWPDIRITACSPSNLAVSPGTVIPIPTLAGQTPVPIIVDDDGSPDGLIALLYFLGHPEFDVQAVTISYGEAHPELFSSYVAQMLAGLHRDSIPVGYGRGAPLQGNNAFPDPWRESSDKFWDIQLEPVDNAVKPVPAVDLIVETLSNAEHPVIFFLSGSHTNLAAALRAHPEIAEKIRAIHVMGGSIYVPGNIESDWPEISNAVAEWNIWVDPLAAAEVFTSGIPIHLAPLDATNQVVWTSEDISSWTSSGSLEGDLAAEILQWMLKSWSEDGVYIWDLMAAADVPDSQHCPTELLAIDVILSAGPEQGRTIVTDGTPNIAVCLQPDVQAIKAQLVAVFNQ